MEPIGTITCYFPFIDEETKNVLKRVMGEASDYNDFVHKLGNMVLSNDSPVLVVYFAIHHSILSLNHKLIDSIREKYGHHQILGPNLFFSSAYQGTVEDTKKVHELADAILATDPEDWIALEMNCMKFEADMRNYPSTIYQASTMERIRELIDSNPHFGFYEAILDDYLAIQAHTDGDTEERLRRINRGLRTAEKFDDKVRIAHFLIRKSDIILNQDRDESKALLQKAYEIVDSWLGIPANFAGIIYNLCVLDAIRGEFDNAIKQGMKAITIRETAGLNTANASYFLSILYNVMGEAESGLEWSRMTEDQLKSRPYLLNRAILNQIWSLTLLKRLIEAQSLMDAIRESILKSGEEGQLAWYHFVTGIMEMAQGDFSSASNSIAQALRIYEQVRWAFLMELIFLLHLAKAEVYACAPGAVISPSLAVLEDRVVSEDLPGFLGLVLLLKAEVAILNNDDSLIQEIIKKLQPLTEKESLQFLKPYFEILLKRI